MHYLTQQFPTQVSDVIELPDMGELLMSPAFQNVSAEDFRRCGSEFQRSLLDKVPLRNDFKFVTVRSGVWLLHPGTRSHTRSFGDWHIDGTTNSGEDEEHRDPKQRVYILSSACTALTEFLREPIEIPLHDGESRRDFINRVRRSELTRFVPAPIEPYRIYTFSNHFHRAVDPKRIEFRFFLRVVERDLPPSRSRPLSKVLLTDLDSRETYVNMEYKKDEVTIHLPNRLLRVGCASDESEE